MVLRQGIMGQYDDDENSETSIWLKEFKVVDAMITPLNVFECNNKLYYGNHIEAIKQFMDSGCKNEFLSDWLEKNWEKVTI